MLVEVEGIKKGLKYWIFENDLMQASPFKYNPRRNEAHTLKEMLNRAQSFINRVEKINT